VIEAWFSAHTILIQATFVSLLFVLSIQIPLRFGVFSFAGVGAYGIGSYAAAIAVTRYGQPVWLGILLGVLGAAVAGYILALILQRLTSLYLAMATIVFDLMVVVVANNGGDITGGATGIFGVLADITTVQIVFVTLVVVAIVVWSERGRAGRRVEAIREDPELSASLGINVRRMRQIAFVASGAVGALSGGINVGLRSTIAPTDIGFPLIVLALTMIVIGGSSTWLGAAIGATFFVWLPVLLEPIGAWKGVVYGVIVAIAAIWMPGGIVGVVTDAHRAHRARDRSQRTVPTSDDSTQPGASEMARLGALENAPAEVDAS
jgi:branched-chain amino acid transport system permease protein